MPQGAVSVFAYGTRATVPDYIVRAGVSYRVVTDHLGSPRFVVNSATGEIAQRIDFDEWGQGEHRHRPWTSAVRLRGRLVGISDIALVRFGARDYDPGDRTMGDEG